MSQCPNDETSHDSKSVVDDEESRDLLMYLFYIGMALGFVVGFWIVCGTLLFKRSWRIAFYGFFDDMGDLLHATVARNVAKFQKKWRIWLVAKSQKKWRICRNKSRWAVFVSLFFVFFSRPGLWALFWFCFWLCIVPSLLLSWAFHLFRGILLRLCNLWLSRSGHFSSWKKYILFIIYYIKGKLMHIHSVDDSAKRPPSLSRMDIL